MNGPMRIFYGLGLYDQRRASEVKLFKRYPSPDFIAAAEPVETCCPTIRTGLISKFLVNHDYYERCLQSWSINYLLLAFDRMWLWPHLLTELFLTGPFHIKMG